MKKIDDDFNVEIKELPIDQLVENKGQIPGVPKNPRKISKRRFEELKKSIERSPEMRKLSEVKVFPFNGKYVVIGGTQRKKAYKELGYKTVLCKILPEDTPPEKIREYIIQDNNAFGENDLDILAENWKADELTEWCIGLEIYEKKPEQDEIKGEVEFTEVLNEEHNYLVLYFDNEVDWLQAKTLFGLKSVRCLSTRSDGTISKGREKYAVGRVLYGPNAINNLLIHKEGENENISQHTELQKSE